MMSAAEMAEMVRVLAEAGMTPGEIAQACARVVGAGEVGVMPARSDRQRSKGAIRTARWRHRRRIKNVTGVTVCDAGEVRGEGLERQAIAGPSGNVVQFNASRSGVTGVTKRHRRDAGDKKERSPTPPKEKTTPYSPKRGLPPASPAITHERILRSDLVFAEIAMMRGIPVEAMQVSDRGRDWWFTVEEVGEARRRLGAREGPLKAGSADA